MLTWEEACKNIGRTALFKYDRDLKKYEGKVVGLDHPRGEPGTPSHYFITFQEEEIKAKKKKARFLSTVIKVPVGNVEWTSDPVPRIAAPNAKMALATILNFYQLQKEVGEWSQENFGNNALSNLRVLRENKPLEGEILVEMGPLCALLGIGEEIGEYFMGADEDGAGRILERFSTVGEKRDSLGDLVIYSCDYAERSGLSLLPNYDQHLGGGKLEDTEGLVGSLGQLLHAELKHLQGIRGFDDVQKYKRHCNRWLGSILAYASAIAINQFGTPLIVIANETWQNIVSKRNWKSNKQKG